jgi:hypothetical protein
VKSRSRIFKNKPFSRFARKCGIDDSELCVAFFNLERGLIDADLGSGIVKQRIARKGEGKSGGFRVIVVYRSGNLAVFVHGFAKSDVGNIDRYELAALKKLAATILAYRASDVDTAVESGALIEVMCDDRNQTIP